MIGITLVCAAGMSTSMLMKKMQDSAKAQDLDVEIRAMSESHFKTFTGQTDVLLIGPQVSFLLDDLKKNYEPKGIKVAVIQLVDYGTMNGAKVLGDALKLLSDQ